MTEHRTMRHYQIGDEVSIPDGRPGPGCVDGVVIEFGRIMDRVRLDDGTTVRRYPHEIYTRDDG